MERNYRKLWWRHWLTIGCFSLFPLLLASFSSFLIFDRIYTEKAKEGLAGSAENRRDAIDLFFSERLAQLYTIANSHTLRQLTDPTVLNQVFASLQAQSNTCLDIGIIDHDGNHLAYAGPSRDLLKPVNYSNEPWFSRVRANGIAISDIFMGFRGVPHCVIAVLVREKNSSWVLRVTISQKTIDDLVQKAWSGKQGDAFLINGNNALQTRPRFDGNSLRPQASAELPSDTPESPPSPDFSAVVTDRVERIDRNGVDAFYAACPLRTAQWILVIKQRSDELLSPLQRGRYWLALFTLLGLTVSGTGAALFTNALISRIKETDRENAARADMLLQANKMIALSKIAAGIAHEVNNPLAAIAEKAGWLKDLLAEEDLAASPNAAEFAESVDKIEQHVARARKVILNLLGFARRMEPAREKIDLRNLLDQTTGFLDNQARYAGIRIEKQFADNVPAITSDLSQIQQVVLNLLNNALDAIGSKGTITVSTRYDEQNREVEISIADTGHGIPESELGRIFDPFYTTKEAGKGTGLGLSISSAIIGKLGGTIKVQSKVGQGTVFTLLLPEHQPAGPDPIDRPQGTKT